ncbi:autotransporter outer membrane beta-barrel domain-containing protein [Microvirga sp. W0021]|uniref:Autotransporter outer membrane beta-barrel domain-containing protein n=1 Tax=Hohaiivirga grylli TaxID=3133970 RepID=A0ABV0BJZ4_9HYPH
MLISKTKSLSILHFLSVMAVGIGVPHHADAQTYPPVIVSNGSTVTLPGGDSTPYINSGAFGYALAALSSGSTILITGGGGIRAESTNLTQTGVVYVQSGGRIDLGTGSYIKGEGYNAPAGWTGAVGLSAKDTNSYITARDVTIELKSDNPLGAYVQNNGVMKLTGLTTLSIYNAGSANNASYALAAISGATLTAENVRLVMDGTNNLYSTYAYGAYAVADTSSSTITSVTVTGHFDVDITSQLSRVAFANGFNSLGNAAQITLNSISGNITGTSNAAYALQAQTSGQIKVTGDIDLTATASGWSIGAIALSAGQISLSNTGLSKWTIVSNTASAAGIYASGTGSTINMDGQSRWDISSLGTSGFVYGIYSGAAADVTLTGNSTWTLNNTNNTAAAFYVSSGGSIIQTGSMAMNAAGNEVSGIVLLGANSSIRGENIQLITTGVTASSYAIYASGGTAAQPGKITLSDSILQSNMQGIAVEDGYLDLNLIRTRLTNDSGIAFNVSATSAGSTSLSLNADASQFTGIAMTDALSQFDLLLKNNSSWVVTGDSTLSTLRNENSTVAFSSPENNVFKTLTVTNYTGNNGTLVLNTVLGTDASPSDLLVIDGGTATGTTNLVVMNAGGLGALTTGDGIMVVEAINGGTTDAGAFVQSSRIAAGAYDYTLVRGGSLSADNWYLTSAYMPPDEPGGGEVPTDNGTVIIPLPNYRPEIALASAIQPIAAEYGYAMLDTLHERVGDTFAIRPFEKAYEERVVRGKNGKRQIVRVPVQPSAESQKWFAGAWGRLFGNRGFQDRGGSFLKNGPKYDYTFGGIQAGLDIYGRETSAGTDKAGLYVGYGNIWANVKGAYGGKAGSIDMDAYTIGAYWTHKATQGWYTDAVVQGTWYTTDATSVYGQKLKPDGFGFIASLEGGYSFDLGNGLMLEPQVQLAYQHLSFDSFSDAYGHFSIADGDSLRGRIGARLVKNWDMSETGNGPRQLTTWLRANIWHEFMGKSKTTVTDTYGLNGVTIPSNLGGTWGEIGAGASMLVSENVTMFATGAYSRSLDNKGREAWDGRLGMTVKW